MEEEVQALCEDFAEALFAAGPHEALAVLQSFTDVLARSRAQAIRQLSTVYQQALQDAARRGCTEETWAAHARLWAELHALTGGDDPAAQLLQQAWRTALSSVLLGKGAPDADEHLARLTAIQGWAGDAVAGTVALHSSADALGRPAAALALARSAAFFAIQHPDGTQSAAAAELANLLLAKLHGHGATATIQHAFQAAMEVAQAVPATAGPEGDSVLRSERARQFLALFKRGSPALVDAWWGVHASAVYQLVAAAEENGELHSALGEHSALRVAADVLCYGDSAHMLVRYLLASPTYAHGKDSAKRALQATEALLQGDAATVVSGCAELLVPEANAALAARQEALHVMHRVAERFLSEHADVSAAQAQLWRGPVLEILLYALSRDPSIRIRRGVLKLLAFLPLGDRKYCQQLLHALCARYRDKDADVRLEAYQLLQRFPATALRTGLTLATWRCVLDSGLTPRAGKQSAGIRVAAIQLLRQYLGLGDAGDGAWAPQLGHLLDGKGVDAALHAAYSEALREVLPPATVVEALLASGNEYAWV